MRIGGNRRISQYRGGLLKHPAFGCGQLAVHEPWARTQVAAGAVLGFGGIALILTFSRGGWIALFVSMILFGLFLGRQRGLSLRAPSPSL